MKSIKFEIKWGVIFVIVALLWMLLERLVGLHSTYISEHAIYTNFFAIVAIAVYVLALKSKRDHQLSGHMSWTEGFVCGVKISVVVALLSPVSQWLTHNVITPDYFANAIAYAVEAELMTQEKAEAYFDLSNYIVSSIIFAFVVGVVTSAIVAFFVKKSVVEEHDTEAE